MDNNTIICSNCGATCKATDEYCKRCWKKLNKEAASENSLQDDKTQPKWVEWELFIDKNADRYIEIYQENSGKKLFPHMNWAAFLFGLNWVLYRRMFKVAVIGFFVTALLSTLLFSAFLLPHRAEIISLQESTDSFASLKIENIIASAQLITLCLVPLSCVFWGLFGDSIYQMHIKKKIGNSKNGGTSVAELFGGRILFSVISAVLLNPLTTLLTAILIG